MARSLDQIADDLDALGATIEYGFGQMSAIIGQLTGVPARSGPLQLWAEDGRALDVKALAAELREHAHQ